MKTSHATRKETKFAGAYIPEDQHADLSFIASNEHRTLADHMRKLIADEIESHAALLAARKQPKARRSA